MSTEKDDVQLFKRKTAAFQAQLDDFADYLVRWKNIEQLKMRMKSAEKTWEAYSNLFSESAEGSSSDHIKNSFIWAEFKKQSDKYFDTMEKAQRIIKRQTWIYSWYESATHNAYCIIKYFVYFIAGLSFLAAFLKALNNVLLDVLTKKNKT